MEINACRDDPSPLDICYEQLEEWGAELPIRLYWSWIEIQNQWLSPKSKMWCWQFGMVHCTNLHNHLSMAWEQYWWLTQWLKFVDKYKTPTYDPIIKGSSLQNNLKFARDEKMIDGYVKISTKEQVMHSIFNKRMIYTGSSKIDWKATRDSKDKYAVVTDNGAWHIFAIVGYWKKGMVCLNSYWPNYMDKWYFYIRREDIWCLFSMYSLLDFKDKRSNKQIKERLNRLLKNRDKW